MPAPKAAWINDTAGHALDYDDVALHNHPSTVLVPAILAEGGALRASRPSLSEAELFDKLRGCLDAGCAKITPEVLFERPNHLEDLSARKITRID